MSHPGRRFPPPWTVKQINECFIVEDATGFPVSYVYFDDRQVDILHGGKMTRDEARRIASNIAKLPGLLGAQDQRRPGSGG